MNKYNLFTPLKDSIALKQCHYQEHLPRNIIYTHKMETGESIFNTMEECFK